MEQLSTLRPSAGSPQLGRTTFYEVQAGDSLLAIATRFGLEVTALAAANGFAPTAGRADWVGELAPGRQLQVNGF